MFTRSLSRKNKCFDCVKALISDDGSAHQFLCSIDRGRLTSAVKVCLESEKVLQRLLKASGDSLPRTTGKHDTVASAVLENTGNMNLFSSLYQHQFEAAVEDNHIHLLIKSVAAFYARKHIYQY